MSGAPIIYSFQKTLKFFYQDVIEIEATAQALQDRVSKIMSAIMASVAASSDIKDATSRIENDVTNLGGQVSASNGTETNLTPVLSNRTLDTIRQELDQIKGKKKWLLALSKGSIKSKIEECTNRLNDAVQIFQVRVFDIHWTNLIMSNSR